MSRPAKPSIEFDPAGIATRLQDNETWICWDYEWKPDRDEWAKVPKHPDGSGANADPTDPDGWTTLENAAETAQERGWGIGFCFSGNIVGIDLDDCRDPDTGEIAGWARDWVHAFNSFTQVSTSGTGLHVFVLGEKPGARCRTGDVTDVDGTDVEMYDDDRFFVMTGDRLDLTPGEVREGQEVVDEAYAEWFGDDDDGADETTGQATFEAGSDASATDLDDEQLIEKAKNSKNGNKFDALWNGIISGYPSQSEADLAFCGMLAFWTGGSPARMDRLFRRSGLMRDKWDENRGDRTYGEQTIGKALEGRSEFYDPKKASVRGDPDGGSPPPDDGDGGDGGQPSPVGLFERACKLTALDPTHIEKRKSDGDVWYLGVRDVIGHSQTLANAHRQFRRNSSVLDGKDRRDVLVEVAWMDLTANGEFFQTEPPDDESSEVYYFHEPELSVYRVSKGSEEGAKRFRGLIGSRLGIAEDSQGRSTFVQVARRAAQTAPERDVHRFAAWNEDDRELYVTDFDTGYFVLDGSGEVDHRPNGTDVFFLAMPGEPITYLDTDTRDTFDGDVPGELPPYGGSGDLLHRFVTNRINYSEGAATGPMHQRLQLYLHLHLLPFIDRMNARPIMAWVGEKGSGKTVIQRSIGRFVFGEGWQETLMPDEPDDFLAIVANQPLAFIDNFDEGKEWANDLLAAVATGAGVFRREYYTTLNLAQYRADCFLSITSRDPPFRRDDVADRTLVFHLDRLDSFLATREFLRPIKEYRDTIWSEYLDNLDRIVAELTDANLASFDVSHRMADWATMAVVAGRALDCDDVEDMLEVIQTEQAAFSLEGDVLREVLDGWLDMEGARGTKWTAGGLHEELVEYAEANNIPFEGHYGTSIALAKRLSSVRSELDTLYGFEVDESGKQNAYVFEDRTSKQERF